MIAFRFVGEKFNRFNSVVLKTRTVSAAIAGVVLSIGGYCLHAAGQGTPGGGGATGPCTTYTSAEDFENGNLFNLNVVQTPDDEACLVLKGDVKAWPYIGVANSNRGTISRIAVDNSVAGYSEGDVVGEYLTSPAGLTSTNGGPSPSRTTVDAYGNIWVGNREETGTIANVAHGSVTRVGLAEGGTRGDKIAGGGFSANPNGDYLQGPFTYCTCEDRDNDGLIKTSKGYPHNNGLTDYANTILPWSNAGNAYLGGVAQAEDECITAYVRVKGTGVRFVSLDPFGDVWTGGNYNKIFEKIDGDTALVDNTSTKTLSQCSGYGGLVDKENVLWSAPSSTTRYDINANNAVCLSVPSYGVGIDPITNEIWTSSGNTVNKVTPAGVLINSYNNGAQNFFTQGIVVDTNSSVWSAHSIANGTNTTVGHNKTTGLHVGNVDLLTNPSSANANGPTGVAVDTNDKIWATNFYTSNTMRIDPSIGPIGNGAFNIGAVDLVVDLGPNSGPYNYSDMTGSVLLQAVAPQGSWTFVHDGGKLNCSWGTLSWNAVTGPNSSVEVRVRASNSPLPSGPWTTVSNGVAFTGVTGQYLQVQVTLHRKAKTDDNVMLCDLTICKEPDCTGTVESILCSLDGSGSVTVNLEVFNNTNVAAQHLLFTPMPPGSPVTITPNMLLNNPIPIGGSKTVTLTISGLTPGQEFCFITTLLDDTFQQCCSFETCINPDCDCLQVHPGSETIVCDPATGQYTYSFKFDNLTPDVLHHIFLFPPAGIKITPTYMPLVPPVGPGQTSQLITLTISGPNAVANAQVCFMMSIHNINMNECCAREICITLPDCETKKEPDDPENCHMTAVVSCCPQDDSVTTVLTICNNNAQPTSFPWSIASSPNCTVIPAAAISPNSGVTPPIQPGQCVNIPITVQCAALGGSGVPGATACLVATVIKTDGTAGVCTGKVQVLDDPVPGWCVKVDHVEVAQRQDMPFPGVVDLGDGQSMAVHNLVSNFAIKPGLFAHAYSATSPALLLNGQYSGQTPTEYQTIPPGTQAELLVNARFTQVIESHIHDVFLLADVGGGFLKEVSSVGVRSIPLSVTNCPGDCNGDDTVNVDDLLVLLAAWGACPQDIPGGGPFSTCPADLNYDAMVNVDDLLILLSHWGSRASS